MRRSIGKKSRRSMVTVAADERRVAVLVIAAQSDRSSCPWVALARGAFKPRGVRIDDEDLWGA